MYINKYTYQLSLKEKKSSRHVLYTNRKDNKDNSSVCLTV